MSLASLVWPEAEPVGLARKRRARPPEGVVQIDDEVPRISPSKAERRDAEALAVSS